MMKKNNILFIIIYKPAFFKSTFLLHTIPLNRQLLFTFRVIKTGVKKIYSTDGKGYELVLFVILEP
jgi:hypothetical protein